MARKCRRYRPPRPGHLVTFGPCLALPAWSWTAVPHAVHWAVAGALFPVVLLAWPPLVVAVLFGLPCLPSLLVPRSWRIVHRHRHGRDRCRSARIPQFLRRLVFAADRGHCVSCGDPCAIPGQRQVDHVRPWAGGGLSTLFNLVTLCGHCNRVKSNYWQDRDGYVHYRGFAGSDDRILAARILRRERTARLNPLRWVRVAWALGT